MSEPWIKMRINLGSCPKVVRILSALQADKFRTVGGLHAVWALFDLHSVDGVMDGYTLASMSEMIGWPGFAEAMASVGWLEETAAGLIVPRFSDHNGASAKRRAMDAHRKINVRKMSASDADILRTKCGPEKEKEKEEEPPFYSPHGGETKKPLSSATQPKPKTRRDATKGEISYKLAQLSTGHLIGDSRGKWCDFVAHCVALGKPPSEQAAAAWVGQLETMPPEDQVKTLKSWIAARRYSPPPAFLEQGTKADGPPPRPAGCVKGPWQDGGHWLADDSVGRLWWSGKAWARVRSPDPAPAVAEFLSAASRPEVKSVFEG